MDEQRVEVESGDWYVTQSDTDGTPQRILTDELKRGRGNMSETVVDVEQEMWYEQAWRRLQDILASLGRSRNWLNLFFECYGVGS